MIEKKLYPLRFIPTPSVRVWGGNSLINELGKSFVEKAEDGSERKLTTKDKIAESWEIADMGALAESVVENGYLKGNTIEDLMGVYFDRLVGEHVYNRFGSQFPLLIKYLDICDRLSFQVHPDDEIGATRYDSLGKTEMWYIVDADDKATLYMGFNKAIDGGILYDKCHKGTILEDVNTVHPKKGDVIFIKPGTVHAANGHILVAEIQESSDLTFRLYDWGREFDPKTARKMHLEEAMDFIDYEPYKWENYHKAEEFADKTKVAKTLVDCPHFKVSKLEITSPIRVRPEDYDSFIVYMCLEGKVSIQFPEVNSKGETTTDNYILEKGQVILIPAEIENFVIVPMEKESTLIEAYVPETEEDRVATEYIEENIDFKINE